MTEWWICFQTKARRKCRVLIAIKTWKIYANCSLTENRERRYDNRCRTANMVATNEAIPHWCSRPSVVQTVHVNFVVIVIITLHKTIIDICTRKQLFHAKFSLIRDTGVAGFTIYFFRGMTIEVFLVMYSILFDWWGWW